MWKNLKPYIISVLIALGVGGLAALLTRNNMDIYQSITRPPLSPPSWLFPVVWTVLYILMGISSAMVYIKGSEGDEDASSALRIYALQLAANFFWSIIFFNMQAYLFAFIWIILLWVLIIIMIKRFYEVSPVAAWLQIPYLLWVTFAAYLNLMIYFLN
ncbi:MAG: tryptophan-rich sensory protein [Clostridia bacterium]|nr:tryptophan-rich sensory protein [Clostridia bacterium]